jgi:hypothetical protein
MRTRVVDSGHGRFTDPRTGLRALSVEPKQRTFSVGYVIAALVREALAKRLIEKEVVDREALRWLIRESAGA